MINSATHRVEVAYPAPQFEDLDELLGQLASHLGGCWSGSSIGLVEGLAERDIKFHFNDAEAARQFARKSTCIIGVRIVAADAAGR